MEVLKTDLSTPSQKGTKIGASIGAVYAGVGYASLLKTIKDSPELKDTFISATNVRKIGAGILLGTLICTGIGALIGKGVGKVVEHFKNNKTETKAN